MTESENSSSWDYSHPHENTIVECLKHRVNYPRYFRRRTVLSSSYWPLSPPKLFLLSGFNGRLHDYKFVISVNATSPTKNVLPSCDKLHLASLFYPLSLFLAIQSLKNCGPHYSSFSNSMDLSNILCFLCKNTNLGP